MTGVAWGFMVTIWVVIFTCVVISMKRILNNEK